MFSINKSKISEFTRYQLTNSDTAEFVSVITGFGGNVTEMVLNKNGKLYSIIAGLSDDEIASQKVSFKSTKLIPFPNRIENGHYAFMRKSYQLPTLGGKHALHGLMFDKTLEVIETVTDHNHASIIFKYSYDGSQPGYPFKYEAIITYSLMRKNGFVCDTNITNVDAVPLPFGDGWHPYFKTQGKVDDLQLRIPSKYRVEVDDLIPTGKLIPEEYPEAILIGKTNYDTGFVLENKEGIITTEIYDPELDIKILVWQEAGQGKYNYLQVYIPKDRNSIAVEPMSCATNAFNNKMGLTILEPGQSFMASYGVYLK